jgi:dTDP-4-dehydrorhamnose reductase
VNIVVFGAGGQVGDAVRRAAWPASDRVIALDRAALDIEDAAAVGAALVRERAELVINLAAYTAVDRAESEPERAFAINATAPGAIAAACRRQDAALIHLSTDYVFDGSKATPYAEDDPVNPMSVYGRSKEAGERAVRTALDRHVILRTSWVFGRAGANFVKTMLRLAAERPVLRVVADQHGCPTAAADIAAALVAIAARIAAGQGSWGTYHFADAEATTWHGFAGAIVDLAAPHLGARPRVEAIATADYPTAARRPANSVLDCRRIAADYGVTPPPWRPALAAVIGALLGPAQQA